MSYVLSNGVALPLPRGYLTGGSVDQGVDYAAPGGTPLYAMGDGVIIGAGISGFGPNAPILKITSGPLKGMVIYYGHAGANSVHVGQHVRAGQQISQVGYGIVGISTGPHLEVGFYPPGSMGAGSRMLSLINSLLGQHSSGRVWGTKMAKAATVRTAVDRASSSRSSSTPANTVRVSDTSQSSPASSARASTASSGSSSNGAAAPTTSAPKPDATAPTPAASSAAAPATPDAQTTPAASSSAPAASSSAPADTSSTPAATSSSAPAGASSAPADASSAPAGDEQHPGRHEQHPGRHEQHPGRHEQHPVELGRVRQLVGTRTGGIDRAERRQHEHRVKRLEQPGEQRAVLDDE